MVVRQIVQRNHRSGGFATSPLFLGGRFRCGGFGFSRFLSFRFSLAGVHGHNRSLLYVRNDLLGWSGWNSGSDSLGSDSLGSDSLGSDSLPGNPTQLDGARRIRPAPFPQISQLLEYVRPDSRVPNIHFQLLIE